MEIADDKHGNVADCLLLFLKSETDYIIIKFKYYWYNYANSETSIASQAFTREY